MCLLLNVAEIFPLSLFSFWITLQKFYLFFSMPNCIECSDSRTWFSWTNNFTELQQETTKASGIHTFQYVKTMIRCFFIEMHGRSLERCKEAASKECYILVMSIHKALVFCYFSFSQVLSCYMVYGPIALASYLMVFTCCLTVQLL